jgi:5'-AMP-activated protein kinase, regulatory gamma subunit
LIATEVEKAIGVLPIETVAVHPLKPLYEACRRMIESRARRIPIVDVDDETQREMVVSVLTQYRILKFIAVNCVAETEMLRKPLKDINLGTYGELAYAEMDTPVIEVIHLLVKKNIASVPILDTSTKLEHGQKDYERKSAKLRTLWRPYSKNIGVLLNVFEAVDVITLIQGGNYDDLNMTVGEAILKRPEVRVVFFC